MSKGKWAVVIVVACAVVTVAAVAYAAGRAKVPAPDVVPAVQSEVVDSQGKVRAEPAESRVVEACSERMLALLFFRTDVSTTRFQPEIFPLAIYSQNEFTEAAVYPEDEPGRQTPLRHFKDFGIYKDGRRVGEMTVDDIVSREYGTVEVLVGLGAWEMPPQYFRSSKGFLAFGSEPDGYRLLSPLLACSPPVPSAELRQPLAAEIEQKVKTALEREAAAALSAIAGKGKKLRIDRLDFRSLDLEKDGIPEVMGTFSATVRSHQVNGGSLEDVAYYFAIGRWEQSGLQLLYTETQVEEPLTVGWGPYLLDALDVDGNRVAEVVLCRREAGWVTFSVLGFRDGKLKDLLTGGGMGH